jgi:hypothetical protein
MEESQIGSPMLAKVFLAERDKMSKASKRIKRALCCRTLFNIVIYDGQYSMLFLPRGHISTIDIIDIKIDFSRSGCERS